tara:strand:- start:8217 stop:8654 length:438 start_codon:yes stop_codon:yes gene_type:complete
MSRSGAITTIKTIMNAVSSPTFQVVLIGEPLSIPTGDRVIAAYFNGESAKTKTLGNVMVTQNWTVRAYFRVAPSQKAREALELELWDAVRSIQTGFRADSQLGGNVTDLDISLATVGWIDLGGNTFRSISFDLQLIELEAESISP